MSFSVGYCDVCPFSITAFDYAFRMLKLFIGLKGPTIELAGGGAMFVLFRIFFRTTQELDFIFFCRAKRKFFSQKVNIRLYDKNSESDYFFFLHQNQNIFSATFGTRIFSQKKTIVPPSSLEVKWSVPNITSLISAHGKVYSIQQYVIRAFTTLKSEGEVTSLSGADKVRDNREKW